MSPSGFISEVASNLVAGFLDSAILAIGGPAVDRIREDLFARRVMSKVVSKLCTGFEELESAEGEVGELLVVDEQFFNNPQARMAFLECLTTGIVGQERLRNLYTTLYGSERLDRFERNMKEAVAIFQRELDAALEPAERVAFVHMRNDFQQGIALLEKQTNQSTHALLADGARTQRQVVEVGRQVVEVGRQVEETMSSLKPSLYIDLVGEHRAHLDQCRGLLQRFRPRSALTYLRDLKDRIWDTARPDDKVAILTIMGHAHLLLNNEPEAGRMFIQALTLAPSSAKALSNAAFGHLLRGDIPSCRKFARDALEADPTLDQASAALVYAASPDDTWLSIVAAVPETHREMLDVTMALGYVAVKRGILAEAERWYRVAVDNNTVNLPDPLGLLADVLVKRLLEEESVYPMLGLINPVASRLNTIIELYDTAWERVSHTDLHSLRLNWLINRATAKALLNDVRGAIHDVEEALKDRRDNPELIRQRAVLAYQCHDLQTAVMHLRSIVDNEATPDARFWLGLILLEDHKMVEACQQIQVYADQLDKAHPGRKEAVYTLAGIKLRLGNLDEARMYAECLQAEFPTDPGVWAFCAQVARHNDQPDNARSLLESALAHITQATGLLTRYRVFDELYAQERFKDAACVLESIVDTKVDAGPTRQLLLCYYRAGELEPALEICQNLREQHGPLHFVTAIESAIYEEIQDLVQARQVCDEYLIAFPKDTEVQLRRAIVAYRLSEFDILDKILDTGINISELTLHAHTQLAQLYLLRGRMRKAIDVAYEARRLFFKDSNAHLAYVRVYIRVKDPLHHSLEVNKVAIDTAIQANRPLISGQDWIIIEDSPHSDIGRGEYPSSHPLIRALLGRQKDKSVTIPYGVETKEFTIQKICSKYTYAWVESLEIYPSLFYGEPGIWHGQVEMSADGRVGPESFRSLFNMLDRISANVLKEERSYLEGKHTLGSLAVWLGRNPIQVRNELTSRPDMLLHCSVGDQQSLNNAVNVLASRRPLIVDITSLITVYELGLGDAVLAEFGKLGIVRGTLELIIDLLQQDSWLTGDRLTFARDGRRYVPALAAEEYSRETLENVLVWAETACNIHPCRAALSVQREERLNLGKEVGQTFLDTILVAADEDRFLYSDDMMLRELATSEYKVAGVWTQPLLMVLRDRGTIDSDTYNRAVVQLACLGYRCTNISPAVLLKATEMAEQRLTYPLPQTLRMLGGKWFDYAPSVKVGVEYIYALWQKKLSLEQYTALIDAVLDALTADRGMQRMLTIQTFLEHIRLRFSTAQWEITKIENLVQSWLATHIW
ncbi:MAG: hypothetical protein GY832_45420 [Chloroflexi bacterium]|nr:hypothetical protein [Chloroflexota bacterium]